MLTLTLDRMTQAQGATLGRLHVPGVPLPIWTLEDEWKANQVRVSCIPQGVYLCKPHGWEPTSTVHFKQVWEVTKVPGRTAILIHAGNNDRDTQGCIMPGLMLNIPAGTARASVLQSRSAIDILRKTIGENQFVLEVNNPKGL